MQERDDGFLVRIVAGGALELAAFERQIDSRRVGQLLVRRLQGGIVGERYRVIVPEVRGQVGPAGEKGTRQIIGRTRGRVDHGAQRHGPVVTSQAEARFSRRLTGHRIQGRASVLEIGRPGNFAVPERRLRPSGMGRMAEHADLIDRQALESPGAGGRKVVNRVRDVLHGPGALRQQEGAQQAQE
jgi:hypothetical protein